MEQATPSSSKTPPTTCSSPSASKTPTSRWKPPKTTSTSTAIISAQAPSSFAKAADAKVRASIQELGLTAYATSAPTVKTHPLTIPRIGYVHSWQRTQDEGWVRAALDHYEIPYTYFADQKLRDGNLRSKYDVIIFPSIGGTSVSQVNGIPKTGPDAIPYKKTKLTPNLGVEDSSDDIRGGMGIEGLTELVKFVEAGGTLITEGSTTTILPDYGITTRVTVEHPGTMYARGALMRGIIADKKSPIVYGYTGDQMPVYFNQDPVLNTRGGGAVAVAAADRRFPA